MLNHTNAADFSYLRQKAGLSIDEAADLIGRTARTVRRYEAKDNSHSAPPSLVIEKLKDYIDERCSDESQDKSKFLFVDLFAGIGGLRIPFDELNGKCVFTAEWDRFARETYAANFKDDESHHFAEDVRLFAKNPELIPEHDVLLAGFPCQPFSIAGVSKKNSLGKPHGFLCDTQGTLFYDLAKIIDYHRPPVFLLENVKNLERHDGGRTFETIMHVLQKRLGYEVHTKVISSHPWVPQKRERIFIAGFKNDSSFDFDDLELPNEENYPTLGDILDSEVPEKYTLTEKLWTYLQNYKKKHQKAGNGFGFSLFDPEDVSRTLSARYYKDGSEILINQDNNRPRRLTPRECARLMGFDSFGESRFEIPVSDTQAYRQFGNAVVVPVVRAVAQLLRPHLEEVLSRESNEQYQREMQLTKKNA